MMVKVLYRALALLTMSALLFVGCSAAQTYLVGIDADYEPFSYIDENGDAVGFDVESIQWIAEQNGFEVEIVPVAWDGIIPALLQKKIDMVYSGMSITPEREKQVTFSIPYWKVDQGVVVLEDSEATMEEFAAGELIIGVQRSCSADQYLESEDYFGTEMYNDLVASGNIKLYDSFPMSMVALEQGLVDAVIFDDVNINSYIQDKTEFVMLDIIPTGEEYGVAMRNEDTELQDIINAGLEDLMASDKWTELLEKYIIVDESTEDVDEDVADEDVDEDIADEDVDEDIADDDAEDIDEDVDEDVDEDEE